jgi:hypothetical protein
VITGLFRPQSILGCCCRVLLGLSFNQPAYLNLESTFYWRKFISLQTKELSPTLHIAEKLVKSQNHRERRLRRHWLQCRSETTIGLRASPTAAEADVWDGRMELSKRNSRYGIKRHVFWGKIRIACSWELSWLDPGRVRNRLSVGESQPELPSNSLPTLDNSIVVKLLT